MANLSDWLTQFSPDTIVIIGGALLSWLGITKSKKGKADLRKEVIRHLRKWFEMEILPNPALHSKAHELLEQRVWSLATGLQVKKTPAREAMVDGVIENFLAQQAPVLMKAALEHLVKQTSKIDTSAVSGTIPKLGIPTEELPPDPPKPAPQE